MRRPIAVLPLLAAFALTGFAFAGSAAAQENVRVRATIEKVDGAALTVKTREGATVVIRFPETVLVTGVVPANLSDIKASSYVGVAALPQPDGTLKALEVLIFPEAMRGVGEGHRPWDLLPESTMTNATVAETVVRADGPVLTLKYKDGVQTVIVPKEAPVVTFVPANRAALVAGAKIFIVAAQKQADGTLLAPRIAVGLNGFTPPM